jgi:hypothetical protein
VLTVQDYEGRASSARKVLAATASLAATCWILGFVLPTNRHPLPGACSGDRVTGPNYALWAFEIAATLWCIAAMAAIVCATNEQRRPWYLAVAASLVAASLCGVWAFGYSIGPGAGY